jgi:hypothetical protein
MKQSGECMAKAGFFYTNKSDTVTCFVCGISIKDWLETDDPITEHIRFKNNCKFIKYKIDGSVVKNSLKQIKIDQLTLEKVANENSKTYTIIQNSVEKSQRNNASCSTEENINYSCVICSDQTIDIVIWPCKHLCVCDLCSLKITQCPLCRSNIECSFKIFLN